MEMPVAPVHDSKEAMRFRAICDERITIPLDALKQFPEVHAKLVGQLPQSDGGRQAQLAVQCHPHLGGGGAGFGGLPSLCQAALLHPGTWVHPTPRCL